MVVLWSVPHSSLKAQFSGCSVSLNTVVGSSLVNMFRLTASSQHLRASGAPKAQVMEEEEGQSENKQAQSPSIRCAPPALLRFKLWHGRATLGVCGWDFLLQNAVIRDIVLLLIILVKLHFCGSFMTCLVVQHWCVHCICTAQFQPSKYIFLSNAVYYLEKWINNTTTTTKK